MFTDYSCISKDYTSKVDYRILEDNTYVLYDLQTIKDMTINNYRIKIPDETKKV